MKRTLIVFLGIVLLFTGCVFANKHDEITPWNPEATNTFILTSESSANLLLEQWISAYQSGEYAEVYFVDQRDGVFYVWRLICGGSMQYYIDGKSAGANTPIERYESDTVLEGNIYYSFGTDITDTWLFPLVLWKGYPEINFVEPDDERWTSQSAVDEMEAETLAKNVFSDDYEYKISGRMIYLDDYFYILSVYSSEGQEESVAVSADGTLFLKSYDGLWNIQEDYSSNKVTAAYG